MTSVLVRDEAGRADSGHWCTHGWLRATTLPADSDKPMNMDVSIEEKEEEEGNGLPGAITSSTLCNSDDEVRVRMTPSAILEYEPIDEKENSRKRRAGSEDARTTPMDAEESPSGGSLLLQESSLSSFPPPCRPPPALPPLPAEWKQAVDPQSGEKYYYNVETKESTWERPRSGSITQDDKDAAEQDYLSTEMGNGVSPTVEPSNSTSSLADEDEDMEAKVGIQEKDGEDVTPSPSPSDSVKIQQEIDNHSPKKSGWRSLVKSRGDQAKKVMSILLSKGSTRGDQTGEKYYSNVETKESTWERPRSGSITQDDKDAAESDNLSAEIGNGVPPSVEPSSPTSLLAEEDEDMDANVGIEEKDGEDVTPSPSTSDSVKIQQEIDNHSPKKSGWRSLVNSGGDQAKKVMLILLSKGSTRGDQTVPTPDLIKQVPIGAGQDNEAEHDSRCQEHLEPVDIILDPDSRKGPSTLSDSGKIEPEDENHSAKKKRWRAFRAGRSLSVIRSAFGYPAFPGNPEDPTLVMEVMRLKCTYGQLKAATGGFSEKSKLGQGLFGSVYRGVLSGKQVAVKRMDGYAQNQGVKESFMAEVTIIIRLRHRNLIQLLGWCDDAARKKYLLVYELMPNGSLDEALFKRTEKETSYLSWSQRLHILIGTAAGLEYLHQGWDQQVVHRDIKLSNIVLDKDWNAKLGDFGLARLVDHDRTTATCTNVAGTMGYIAPEVISEGRFTEKADVFGFGVVALEVACGRRVFSSHPDGMGLVDFVWLGRSEGDLLGSVDKQLNNDYDKYQMEVVLIVGLLCTHPDPQSRPSMRRVVQILAGDVPVPSIPTTKPTMFCSFPEISINDLQNQEVGGSSKSTSTVQISVTSASAKSSNSSSSVGLTCSSN